MTQSSRPPTVPHTDLEHLLPRRIFEEILLVLRSALPRSTTADPAAIARRDRVAIAAVAALRPVNSAEGRLAAQFVAADAFAMDCLRKARECYSDFELSFQCREDAIRMMRESKSALRMLLRMQPARKKLAQDDAAAARAARIERGLMAIMQEALSEPSPAPEARMAAATPGAAPPAKPRDAEGTGKPGGHNPVLGKLFTGDRGGGIRLVSSRDPDPRDPPGEAPPSNRPRRIRLDS